MATLLLPVSAAVGWTTTRRGVVITTLLDSPDVGYPRAVARTEVVLAVVQCCGQICVARRSQAVATGQGLWSVVTGYLEPDTDALTQAWTELKEELGLYGPDVRLVGRLEPVELTSPASRKEFLVHSFLFECDSADGLVLNWEHDDVQWVDPERLRDADCVSWQYPLVQTLLGRGHELTPCG